MKHPEIESKLTVIHHTDHARVNVNGSPYMNALELAYAGQQLLEAADVLRQNERNSQKIKGVGNNV